MDKLEVTHINKCILYTQTMKELEYHQLITRVASYDHHIASQASWRYLKDVVWILRGFIGGSSKKVNFMVNCLPHHHKFHNKYWMFKEDYEDCSWRIKMKKPASNATQRICLMLYDKTHIEFCATCFKDLLLQLTSMEMMHSLRIFETYSKYHLSKATQDDNIWELCSMSFSKELCTWHKSFNHFQWWVYSRLH